MMPLITSPRRRRWPGSNDGWILPVSVRALLTPPELSCRGTLRRRGCGRLIVHDCGARGLAGYRASKLGICEPWGATLSRVTLSANHTSRRQAKRPVMFCRALHHAASPRPFDADTARAVSGFQSDTEHQVASTPFKSLRDSKRSDSARELAPPRAQQPENADRVPQQSPHGATSMRRCAHPSPDHRGHNTIGNNRRRGVGALITWHQTRTGVAPKAPAQQGHRFSAGPRNR